MEKEFKEWALSLSAKYKEARAKTWIEVNGQMLSFYFDLGQEMHKSTYKEKQKDDFYRNLSIELTKDKVGLLIFSEKNLRKIESFYILNSELITELASDLPEDYSIESLMTLINDILQTMAKVSWSHFLAILDTCINNPRKSWFYIQKTVENGWPISSLRKAIDSKLYEKSMQS